MDIKEKLTQVEKQSLASLIVECQVLQNLLNERQKALKDLATQVINNNTLSPNLYTLECNPARDTWELKLKENAIVVPSSQRQRRMS